MKTSTLAAAPDRSAPGGPRRYLEAEQPFALSNGISAFRPQRRTTWRLGMPEGPVGLCFFEQFVLQTGADNDKQGPNTHMRRGAPACRIYRLQSGSARNEFLIASIA